MLKYLLVLWKFWQYLFCVNNLLCLNVLSLFVVIWKIYEISLSRALTKKCQKGTNLTLKQHFFETTDSLNLWTFSFSLLSPVLISPLFMTICVSWSRALVMIQTKFGFHWSSPFRGEDFLKSLRRTTDDDDERQVMRIAHLTLWVRWAMNGLHLYNKYHYSVHIVYICLVLPICLFCAMKFL
jgi:hypothetical protein